MSRWKVLDQLFSFNEEKVYNETSDFIKGYILSLRKLALEERDSFIIHEINLEKDLENCKRHVNRLKKKIASLS